MEQYYTPNIEDFRIGYEFEFAGLDNNWSKQPFTKQKLLRSEEEYFGLYTFKWLDAIYKNPSDVKVVDHIRVPYLTKEQIKVEGWKDKGNNIFDCLFNDRYYISWYPEQQRIEIGDEQSEIGFAGQCPSINEFRQICKLLKIKD